jgi:hypothetical protein
MPFLTRELPPGGRHIARIVPPAAPVPAPATRMRQLLPVGLLIAASSAGAALTPALSGSSAAGADHDRPTLSADGSALGGTATSNAAYTPRGTISRDFSRDARNPRAGKHRATSSAERPVTAATAHASTATAGKHRADSTATVGSTAQPTTPATTKATSSSTQPTAEAKPAAPASAISSAPTPSASSSSAPSTPTTSATTPPGPVTGTVAGVGKVVGGVLGGVGSLLGSSTD